MTQQHLVVQENNLQKAEDHTMRPAENLSLYISQPNPAVNYAEAVQRVEFVPLGRSAEKG